MTIVINNSSFQNAWALAVKQLMDHGFNQPADDERHVIIKNEDMVINMDYPAIKDIAKHKLHPAAPLVDGLDEYIQQFNPASEQAHKSILEQPYTYLERTWKQFKFIRNNHLLQKPWNKRTRAITWRPFEDLGKVDVACMQSLSFRNIGDGRIHMFTIWRSHDMYGAWQWNNIALYEYVNNELLEPEGLRLTKWTEYNESAHVYDYDWDAAKHVLPLPEVALHMMY